MRGGNMPKTMKMPASHKKMSPKAHASAMKRMKKSKSKMKKGY